MHNFLIRKRGARTFVPIIAVKRIEARLKFIKLEKSRELINTRNRLRHINVPVKNVNKTRIIFKGGV